MDLRQALVEVVGSRHVLSDPELKSSYERDYTGRYGGRARLVVRPADTEQVAGVMAACARAGAAIVPQGGNTGLVGASVPRNGEVLLSLQRLTAIGDVDEAIGQVTVGAGATLAALQDAAKAADQDAALDFGARDSCTVGGVVACDAGGARALRHGTARAHVAGLEAVLADGSIVSRLAGLTKDNAGYNLPQLLVGSEGTLGIITRVRWKLAPLLAARVAALVPLQTAREAADLLRALRADAPSLESCDFFLDEGLELVLEHQQRESPIRSRSPFYVLAECAAQSEWALLLLRRMVAFQILLSVGRFERKELLQAWDRVPLRATIDGSSSKLNWVLLTPAPNFRESQQLPSGRFHFLEFIGITEDEADFARNSGGDKLLDLLIQRKAAPVTHPSRSSVLQKSEG